MPSTEIFPGCTNLKITRLLVSTTTMPGSNKIATGWHTCFTYCLTLPYFPFYFAFNQFSACIAICFIPSGVKVHTPSLLVIHPLSLACMSDVEVLPAQAVHVPSVRPIGA